MITFTVLYNLLVSVENLLSMPVVLTKWENDRDSKNQ